MECPSFPSLGIQGCNALPRMATVLLKVNFSMEEFAVVQGKETENIYKLILMRICDIESSTIFEGQLCSLY